MFRKIKKRGILVLFLGVPFMVPIPAFATVTYTSPNYSVDQVLFGAGSTNDTSSSNYSASGSAGNLGGGLTSSPDYEAYAGFNTNADPYLQFVVTAENLQLSAIGTSLGYLSVSSPAVANATFYVRAWNAHGYVIQTDSPPPQTTTGSGTYSLATTKNATSSPGTEQFGINLVANTAPISYGASPLQTTSFAYGAAATAAQNSDGDSYGTSNQFSYTNGDILAFSNSSTSSTIFTMSYLFNVKAATPDGEYNFAQTLIATATY